MCKRPKMLSSDTTWYKLNRDNNYEAFFEGLQEYLKRKLKIIKIEGLYIQYSCCAITIARFQGGNRLKIL